MITLSYDVRIPIKDLLKPLMNKNGGTLIPPGINNLSFMHIFNPIQYINGYFFYWCPNNIDNDCLMYKNNRDETVIIGKPHIEITSLIYFDKKYINNCKKRYRKIKLYSRRIQKINDEISRITHIYHRIKTEILPNLNTCKKTKASHVRNIELKIIGMKKYNKPVYLYELHELKEDSKQKLVDLINKVLNLSVTINISTEEFFIYISICHILKNISKYRTYLKLCTEVISKNKFSLNKQFMFNNVLENRITQSSSNKYNEMYIFEDHNAYAYDISNNRKSNGYVLALAKDGKWNSYPAFNDNVDETLKTNVIKDFVSIIKKYEEAGYSLEAFIMP